MLTTARPEVATLPQARGPLSAAVLERLRGGIALPAVDSPDPYGDDLQLALHCCYELRHRGFVGVDPELEWDPPLLGLRRDLERTFPAALRRDVERGDDVDAEVAALLVEPVDGDGVSHHLRRDGELWPLREYVAHRSIYPLKEVDPRAWVIPRLAGAAKATLAEVNFMSLCGLHRSLRGASVGQFAMVELTSSPGSDRLVRAALHLSDPFGAELLGRWRNGETGLRHPH